MDAFGLLATVLVMAGVVVAILLFEKSRAEGIRRDTRRMSEGSEGRKPEDDEH
ncbi:hypothetical protein [Nocardioides sp. Soil774]|uniref:hypothetical protein n=1 Tax=Nocardioides sp. Soil774 TaxID=1736408 RepID=UPI000B2E9ED0|nr:hypothetical protein [Nocardioides sp. Soil774]